MPLEFGDFSIPEDLNAAPEVGRLMGQYNKALRILFRGVQDPNAGTFSHQELNTAQTTIKNQAKDLIKDQADYLNFLAVVDANISALKAKYPDAAPLTSPAPAPVAETRSASEQVQAWFESIIGLSNEQFAAAVLVVYDNVLNKAGGQKLPVNRYYSNANLPDDDKVMYQKAMFILTNNEADPRFTSEKKKIKWGLDRIFYISDNLYGPFRDSDGGINFKGLTSDASLNYQIMGGEGMGVGFLHKLADIIPCENPNGDKSELSFPAYIDIYELSTFVIAKGLAGFGFEAAKIGGKFGDLGELLWGGFTHITEAGKPKIPQPPIAMNRVSDAAGNESTTFVGFQNLQYNGENLSKFQFELMWKVAQCQLLERAFVGKRAAGGTVSFGGSDQSAEVGGNLKTSTVTDLLNPFSGAAYDVASPPKLQKDTPQALLLLKHGKLSITSFGLVKNQNVRRFVHIAHIYNEALFPRGKSHDLFEKLDIDLDKPFFPPLLHAIMMGWVAGSAEYLLAAQGMLFMFEKLFEPMTKGMSDAQTEAMFSDYIKKGVGLYKVMKGGANQEFIDVALKLYVARLIKYSKNGEPQNGLSKMIRDKAKNAVIEMSLSLTAATFKELQQTTLAPAPDYFADNLKCRTIENFFQVVRLDVLAELFKKSDENGEADYESVREYLRNFGFNGRNLNLLTLCNLVYDIVDRKIKPEGFEAASKYMSDNGITAIDRQKLNNLMAAIDNQQAAMYLKKFEIESSLRPEKDVKAYVHYVDLEFREKNPTLGGIGLLAHQRDMQKILSGVNYDARDLHAPVVHAPKDK